MAGFSHAEGAVRCGDYLVAVGDSKAELLMKCGQPLDRTSRYVLITNQFKQQIEVEKETLTIDQGDDKFLGIVTVEDGTITDIQDGPRKQ